MSAWRGMRDTSRPLDERAAALVQFIAAHHERSVDEWRSGGRRREAHPELDEFVRHWLARHGPGLDAADVVTFLQRKYPPPRKILFPPASSTWPLRGPTRLSL